jgi:hypothetical protein
MAFKGINPEARSELGRWKLHPIVRGRLLTELEELFSSAVSELHEDPDQRFFEIKTTDPIDPNGHFAFQIEMDRDGDDYWVVRVTCQEFSGGGDIIWSSEDRDP